MWNKLKIKIMLATAFFGIVLAAVLWIMEGFLHNHVILIFLFSGIAWSISFASTVQERVQERYEEDKWKAFEKEQRKKNSG
ncbi:MAG: hypothetical protein EA412_09755 [Chitinophagaceae bacterium]|nr:MAG: hypothetical protein EA412_09755 [Chitinophagaceae bacterium]